MQLARRVRFLLDGPVAAASESWGSGMMSCSGISEDAGVGNWWGAAAAPAVWPGMNCPGIERPGIGNPGAPAATSPVFDCWGNEYVAEKYWIAVGGIEACFRTPTCMLFTPGILSGFI